MMISIPQKKILGNISREINIELQDNIYSDFFPQFSLDLTRSTHYLFKLQIFVLMKSLLRFSDAKSLNIRKVVLEKTINVTMQKTKKNVVIPFFLANKRLESILSTLTFYSEIWDYVGISNELRYRLREVNFPLDFPGKALTHVFRHLQASFLFSKEYPLSYISDMLGDSENVVKNYYIHGKKTFFFLN